MKSHDFDYITLRITLVGVVHFDESITRCPSLSSFESFNQQLPNGYKYFQHRDDVIKWKHFPRHWPFVRGIHRSPVNSPHKGQWRGALMFSLICAWINGWVNNRETGDLRRHRAHYDVIMMIWLQQSAISVLWISLNWSLISFSTTAVILQMHIQLMLPEKYLEKYFRQPLPEYRWENP